MDLGCGDGKLLEYIVTQVRNPPKPSAGKTHYSILFPDLGCGNSKLLDSLLTQVHEPT